MPLAAGAILAISALSALAQAGGQAYGTAVQGQMTQEQLDYQKRQDLRNQQIADEERAKEAIRYRDQQMRQDRTDVQQQPNNTVNMLNGIKNLQMGLGRSTPVDYLGYLARS